MKKRSFLKKEESGMRQSTKVIQNWHLNETLILLEAISFFKMPSYKLLAKNIDLKRCFPSITHVSVFITRFSCFVTEVQG